MSLQSLVGAPVIIKHQDVTNENADELRCGVISKAYFNDFDGWYYAEGIIWDTKAQELINNKDWSVSCSYDFLSYNDEGGVENNIKYDKEFTSLNFTHLALVNNPRYERANIVFNSKDEENGTWITIKGNHIFIPDGKTLDEVIKEKGWGDSKGDKQSDTKDGSKDISKEEYAKIKEQVSKMSDDELVKAHFESQKGYESETPRAGSMTKHEATYGEVAQELKRRTGRGFSVASTESEIKEALLKAKSNSKGDLDIKKTTVKMKSGKEKEIEYVDKVPAGYKKLEGAMTAPLGYTWYHNGKSIIDKDRRTILVKDNKADNSKEQDMALLEELKKLIFKVENGKENEEMIENEKTDKRKLIDEVAGIMKSAGCDDEDIRTAIGKMEKIGYDASEDSKADNKKVKNEDEEDKKEDKKEDKEVDNEDAEDKKEAEDLKEDAKEDVKNKCKNSKSSFDKINEIYNSVKQIEKETGYVSRQQKLDDAVEYFK